MLLVGVRCGRAMKWLKEHLNPKGALIGVWDMVEFQKQVNTGFPV